MNQYIKFTGDFKILKPMGFTFGKYFAKNYKAYAMKHGEWSTDMMIWVKGRDVQISSFDNLLSFYAAKYILNGTYPVYEEDYKFEHGNLLIEHKKGEPLSCKVNINTGEIIPFSEFVKMYKDKWEQYIDDGWRELNIPVRIFELMKEFFDLKLLQLVEENI